MTIAARRRGPAAVVGADRVLGVRRLRRHRRTGSTVATAFYPLQFVAERVGGDHADVENLTAPGGEPHDLELTVKETAEVAQADLVVYEHGFQPAVDDAVETNADRDQRSTSPTRSSCARRRGARGRGHDDEERRRPRPRRASTRTSGRTRCCWPTSATRSRTSSPRSTPTTPPTTAPTPTTCAPTSRRSTRRTPTGLAGCERDTVVVSHDAFGYLGRYGLEFEAIAGLSPDAEPTAGRPGPPPGPDRGARASRPSSPRRWPAAARRAAGRTTPASTTAVLDPIEGLTDETADEDYLSLMEANLAALEEANGC